MAIITAPIVVEEGRGGAEIGSRPRSPEALRLWNREEMSAMTENTDSSPEMPTSTEEVMDDDFEIIPTETSRVHTNFSSSSLSLVSAGTTTSSGIFGDVKPHVSASSSNSDSTVDSGTSSTFRSSFGK